MRAVIVVLCLAATAHAQKVDTDKAAVRRVVKQHLMKILACYERDGQFASKVVVDFTIGTTGKVTKTTTSGSSQTLQRCVAGVFAKMTFARQNQPVHVSYPVHICVAGQ